MMINCLFTNIFKYIQIYSDIHQYSQYKYHGVKTDTTILLLTLPINTNTTIQFLALPLNPDTTIQFPELPFNTKIPGFLIEVSEKNILYV